MFLLLLIGLLVCSAYWWARYTQNYWQRRGAIPNVPETLFYFGRPHVAHYLQNIYKRYKGHVVPFVGIFASFVPAAFVHNLDFLKVIFVNSFEYFPDRAFYTNPHHDPLSMNLLRMKGEQWRVLRHKLTPTFTPAKMKFMFPTVVDIGDKMVQTMAEHLRNSKCSEQGIDIREWCARYTTDVIASVAYGFDCNSLEHPNNEFRKKGDMAVHSFNVYKEALAVRYHKLFNWLGVKAFPQEIIDFFSRAMIEQIEYRERNSIKRNDFLNLLIELKNTESAGVPILTIQEMIGQTFVFFIAGFETSSSTMMFCLYELSKNPELQERVRQNVIETLAAHDNQFTYECLQKMHLLHQTIAETLRMYPIAPTLQRVVDKDFHLPNSSIVLKRGERIIVPVYAIQHDPAYYPEPEKFDPERFAPSEVQNRHPMAYLPFGAGQRMCIGDRFGKMQTQIGIGILLKNFRFSLAPQMPTHLVFSQRNLRLLQVDQRVWLKVESL